MTSITEPSKFVTPFAESGLKNTIPPASNNTTGKAGFDKGFPERTMLPKASGGIPPSGMDFNGILYDITSAIRYMQAGGKPTFDAAFAAAIGGYPSGAVLIGDDGVSVFKNAVAGNETDPNSGGAGWTRPDLQVMELYRRSYAEAGYNVVGTFQGGFTLVNANDVGIDFATGKGYTGPAGPVAAGIDPASGGFVDQSGNITVDVGTYATLRSYTGPASKIRCLGRSNLFDRASGFFVLDATDSSTADDDATILVGVGGRRWKRQFNGDADVRWWGAADGIECASAFQKAADYSIATGKRIWVDGDFHLDSSVVIGSPSTSAVATFVGPSSSTQGDQFGAKLRFSGCDGFRNSTRNILRLSNILLDGDRGVSPPSSYAAYLLSLTKSAVRSHENTGNANCITFIENCRFIKWKRGLDFALGSWSSAYIGNSFAYCYQAGIHFRPNNTIHHKNTLGFCTRGFELIEQNGGEFTLNELNTGATTEWLIKMNKPVAVDCSNNYVEFWAGGLPAVGGSVNYGLGFIPVIVELERFVTSVPRVNGNKIDVPGAYCGILYVQAPGQENNNYTAVCPQPVGNSIVATNKIVVATTGTGFLAMSEFVAAGGIKTAKINGSTALCMCIGRGALTKMKKSWATRSDITAAVAASSPVAGTPDVVFDTTGGALLTADGAYSPATSIRKSKITISVYAETDATPTNTRITVSKDNSDQKHYFINVPANSKSNFDFVFTQDPTSITADVSVKFSGGTAHPTVMSVEVLREVFISG